MRPKALLSLALPLAVGVEGLGEMCEFALQEQAGPDFALRLAASLPRHISVLGLEPYRGSRSLSARVTGAVYEVRVRAGEGEPADLDVDAVLGEAAKRFAEAPALPIEETREGRVRRVDVKAYVSSVSVEPGRLSFRTLVTPLGTARPEKVVAALGKLAGLRLEIEGITRISLVLT
jgi:radical SAM-linked protein